MLAPRTAAAACLALLLALPAAALLLGAAPPLALLPSPTGGDDRRGHGPYAGEAGPLEGLEGLVSQPLRLGEVPDAAEVPPLPETPGVLNLTFAPRESIEPARRGAEPGIDVHPDGCVFINAIGDRSLWRRCPGETVFTRLSGPPGFAIGGLDTELAIDRDGVVWYSDLWLGSASVLASRDLGQTWSINNPAALLPPVDDRQWLVPLGDGEILHVANQIPAGIGVTRCMLPDAAVNAPVACAPTALVKTNAARFCVCPAGSPGVSADGQHIVIPYYSVQNVNPNLLPLVASDELVEAAVSHDRGLTWKTVIVASNSGSPGIFPAAAIDESGWVYVTWSAKRSSNQGWETWLARSADLGEHWDPVTYRVSEGGTNVMPWIAAGAPGHVALVWYHTNTSGNPETLDGLWRVAFAQSFDMDQDYPTVQRALVSEAPNHADSLSISGLNGEGDRDLLDFFQVTLDAQGLAHIAFADDLTDGHDGHSHVYYTRQTG